MNNDEKQLEDFLEEIKQKKPPVFQGLDIKSLKHILNVLNEFGTDTDVQDIVKQYIKEEKD